MNTQPPHRHRLLQITVGMALLAAACRADVPPMPQESSTQATDAPRAAAPTLARGDTLVVVATSDGRLLLADVVVSEEALAEVIGSLAGGRTLSIVVQAGPETRYAQLVSAIATIERAAARADATPDVLVELATESRNAGELRSARPPGS